MSEDNNELQNTYNIRPNFKQKFRPNIVKDIIHNTLTERLADKTYNPENTAQLTKDISDDIKNQLKDLNLPRYKFVVQVVIGEQKGAGVRMGCRCFWDADTDNYAHSTFMN